MSIKIIEAYTYKIEIKSLFDEYTKTLIDGDSEFKKYLEEKNKKPD